MTAAALLEPLLQPFSQHLARQMGLYFPPARQHDLLRGLERAAPELGFTAVSPCLQALLASVFTDHQVRTLARHLCVGETYFFREPAVFAALEQHVLPALIARRRHTGRRLRLWSAGCSTGEEAYTLAMVLARMLPDLADWDVRILATDIQPQFLAKAAQARYSEWSFRNAPLWLKAQCFERVTVDGQASHVLRSRLRRMVQWRYLNLMDLAGMADRTGIDGIDIVFCRNVLMYFEAATAAGVVQQLHRALAPGGWLVVSPTETGQALFGDFTATHFPGTTFYRKPDPPAVVPAASHPLPPQPPAAPHDDGLPAESRLESSVAGTRDLAAPEAGLGAGLEVLVKPADRPLLPTPDPLPDPQLLATQARALANQGQLAEAWRLCDQAVAADKLDPALRYLAAAVLDEQGHAGQAVLALQQALYLAPGFVLAHLALGHLYQRQSQAGLAARHLAQVQALLDELPTDAVLPCSDGMTAGHLRDMLRVAEAAA